jgi:putative Mn2+ efflux pump MntP
MIMEPQADRARMVRPGAVVAGAILLAIGTAMLLDPTGTLSIHPARLIGPFVLIALGTSALVGRKCGRQSDERNWKHRERHADSTGGLWLIGLGCWLLVSQTHLFGLTFATSWPLLLILMGLLIAARGLR